MDYWNSPHDRHHNFSDLAAKYPRLAHLERQVRNARPRDRDHLHCGFDYVRRQTARLHLRTNLSPTGAYRGSSTIAQRFTGEDNDA